MKKIPKRAPNAYYGLVKTSMYFFIFIALTRLWFNYVFLPWFAPCPSVLRMYQRRWRSCLHGFPSHDCRLHLGPINIIFSSSGYKYIRHGVGSIGVEFFLLNKMSWNLLSVCCGGTTQHKIVPGNLFLQHYVLLSGFYLDGSRLRDVDLFSFAELMP